MIILLIICLFGLSLFSFVPSNFACADGLTYYARVMNEGVFLFRTPTEDTNYANVYFEIPNTYFVKLTGSANQLFYSAEYGTTKGYVKKDSVQAVASTPNCPFLENINFRVYAELSRDLRSCPTTNPDQSVQLTYIPLLSKNLTYIGKVSGECLIEGRTNVWFFCKYSADKDYYGYVYSDFCDNMTTIQNNLENLDYIPNPTFEIETSKTNTIPENNRTVYVIISILCVPAIIFLLMIVKSKCILSKSKVKNKEIIDY